MRNCVFKAPPPLAGGTSATTNAHFHLFRRNAFPPSARVGLGIRIKNKIMKGRGEQENGAVAGDFFFGCFRSFSIY